MQGKELSFQMGKVVSIDATTRKILVVSDEDQSTLEVPLDMAQGMQIMPVVGQKVMVGRIEQSDLRLINQFGHETTSAQASRPLQEGEVMMQGTGGGFFYADKAGNIMMSDRMLSNFIQILVNTRITMVGDSFSLEVKDVGQVTVLPTDLTTGAQGKIELVKTTPGGVPVAKITMQNDKIDVNGIQVNIGVVPIGGAVISTSGIPGPYSFDAFGKPVPCSSSVKVAL